LNTINEIQASKFEKSKAVEASLAKDNDFLVGKSVSLAGLLVYLLFVMSM
jgi:hypothetical protein